MRAFCIRVKRLSVFSNHDIRSFDYSPSLIANLKLEFIYCLIGNGGGYDITGTNIDLHVRSGLTHFEFNNFAAESIACAELDFKFHEFS